MESEHYNRQKRLNRLKTEADKAEAAWNEEADETDDSSPAWPRCDE